MTVTLLPGYLLFVGDTTTLLDAKTARGVMEWRRETCVGQWRTAPHAVDLGLPELTPEAAVAAGARTLVIGVAPVGGRIAEAWIAPLVRALDAGLDLAAGLHQRLDTVPAIAAAARRNGRRLHDVRHGGDHRTVATGARRAGRRVLTVGTDCAIGKKFTALALHREMVRRGLPARFCATGQTGILIAGDGIAIDTVVADFAAGAAEAIAAATAPDHWSIVEGQGSLFHPAYAGVALALLHGAQPEAIVVCHEPGRQEIDGFPGFAIPDVETCIARNLEAARLTSPAAYCAGIALDTSRLGHDEGRRTVAELAARTGLPVVDPLVEGTGVIVDRLTGQGRVH